MQRLLSLDWARGAKSAVTLVFIGALAACGTGELGNGADSALDEDSGQARTDGGQDASDSDAVERDADTGEQDTGFHLEDNMLANPSFEQGEQAGGCPSEWTCKTYPDEVGTFSVDDQTSSSGGHSARWQGEPADASEQPIALFSQQHSSEAGRSYEVSGWYRSRDLETPARIQVLFMDASESVLHTEYFAGESGTQDWTQITGETGRAPAQTAYVRLNVAAVETFGTIWWDAAGLVDVTSSDTNDSEDTNNSEDPSNDPGQRPPDAIDLCDKGLSDGDRINSYIENNFSDGATLVVCRGTYRLSDLSLSGNDWTLIAPEGATLEISGRTSLTTRGSNYRVAGFIFDQSNTSGYFSMHPIGDDWVVDSVAWKGRHPGGGRLLAPAVQSQGTTGLIDRMYMGDGQVEGTESGAVYTQYRRGFDGDLTFRRVYIAHFIDNAIYASSPGKYGHKGCTHVEDSFFWSNTISNARTGSPYQVCHVKGSVFLLDDTTQECGVGCSSPGARTTRAIWAWNGEVLVEDNDFTINHGTRIAIKTYSDRPDGSVTEVNNRVGAEASTDPPAGVPTSPEDIYNNPPSWTKPTL